MNNKIVPAGKFYKMLNRSFLCKYNLLWNVTQNLGTVRLLRTR